MASVNGGPFRAGNFAVHVGDVMTFKLLPPGVTLPSTLPLNLNGKDISLPGDNPLSFTADKAGIWNIRLAMPGFVGNQITVTAR